MKKSYVLAGAAALILALLIVAGNSGLMAQDTKGRQVMRSGLVHPSTNLQQYFGHIILIETYDVPGFKGIHALMRLRDYRDTTFILLTKSKRLQTTLETALTTGHLMFFWGEEWPDAPNPIGGTWLYKVYKPSVIAIYDE